MYLLELTIYYNYRFIGEASYIKAKILPRVGDKIYLIDENIDWEDFHCEWGLVKSVNYDLKGRVIHLDLQAEGVHRFE